jgi:hypothetical protein
LGIVYSTYIISRSLFVFLNLHKLLQFGTNSRCGTRQIELKNI